MSNIRCMSLAKEINLEIPATRKRKLKSTETANEKWGKRKINNKTYFNSLNAVKIIQISKTAPDNNNLLNENKIKPLLTINANGLVTNEKYYKVLKITKSMIISKLKGLRLYIDDFISLYDNNWLTNSVIDYLCSNVASSCISVDLSTTILTKNFNMNCPVFNCELFSTPLTYFPYLQNGNHFCLIFIKNNNCYYYDPAGITGLQLKIMGKKWSQFWTRWEFHMVLLNH